MKAFMSDEIVTALGENNTWMRVSGHVVDLLTKQELASLVKEALTNCGQSENDRFYRALEGVCGTKKAVKLVRRAIQK